jgi:hypothetical protein
MLAARGRTLIGDQVAVHGMTSRLLQSTRFANDEGFLRQAIVCPVCTAGRSMVAMDGVEVDHAEKRVSVHQQTVTVATRKHPGSTQTPMIDLHFTCFAGHDFTIRFVPVAAGEVLMTAFRNEPDRPV